MIQSEQLATDQTYSPDEKDVRTYLVEARLAPRDPRTRGSKDQPSRR